jgi:hypothetical protein
MLIVSREESWLAELPVVVPVIDLEMKVVDPLCAWVMRLTAKLFIG